MFQPDQLGRTVDVPEQPKRIVSLVPSQTELLHHLGADTRVVGITKFCVHPNDWLRNKVRVGGTKSVDVDRIHSLSPDLIIANKEENEERTVRILEEHYPVWVSDISDIASAKDMITSVGSMIGAEKIAAELLRQIDEELASIVPVSTPTRVLYLIWRNPYMAAGTDTFINSMLLSVNAENVLDAPRYPELSAEEIVAFAPDMILYSSEPYPFKEVHMDELRNELPNTKHVLVDGEAFSWYGSRIPHALLYIKDLFS